jgi:hypothetical protein
MKEITIPLAHAFGYPFYYSEHDVMNLSQRAAY